MIMIYGEKNWMKRPKDTYILLFLFKVQNLFFNHILKIKKI
jgi:hypothetical protein